MASERIPYGEEVEERLGDDGPAVYIPRDAQTCEDCGVERGELHESGCDVEQCPVCHTQLLSCEHTIESDDDCALVDLGPYSFIGDEIEYCPFCGADADSSEGASGQATCSACGESFWVEL